MEISTWLRDLGLEQYAEAFEENAVDVALLPRLNGEDLKEIGVRQVGHRRRLLDAIAALHGATPPAAVPAPPMAAPLGPAPAVGAAHGERRQVTVLFADLAGFTRLSTEVDAEELHAIRSGFSDTADRIVLDHGGSVERHIGDCVMGVFGAPLAHDNDPERAILAAMAIVAAMPNLSVRLGRSIDVHVGVASGEVLATGLGGGGQVFTVTGESVNLASRLTGQAHAGEILLSAAVHRALDPRIEAREVEALSVKGFGEPVAAYRLIGLRQLSAGNDHPFVGRQAELRQLTAALAACIETRTGQTILVRGEAGIGKSRLVQELQHEAAAAGFACHASQVLDFGAGRGQDAIRTLVRSLVGLPATADTATAEHVIAATVDADHRVFLHEFLEVPLPADLRSLFSAMDNATRTAGARETAAQAMANVSRARPVLIVIEDIHWAESATLESISMMAETVAENPAILVLTARREEERLDRRFSISGPTLTIDLAPLRRQEALALAGTFSHSWSDFAERCIDRAAGNPLFLEQLLRHAEDRMGSVPDSVQSLVQARMDRLDPADKQALQAASVFGQRFPLDGLRHVLKQPGYDISGLLAASLVRLQGEDYAISHALIRDAIYATLPHGRRRELHQAAAGWFAPRDSTLYAKHLDKAEDARAPQAYLSAARDQAAAYRYERALTLVDRGAALAKAAADVTSLACCRGDLLLDVGKVAEAQAAYEAAQQAAPEEVARARAWLGLAGVKRITDDIAGALADVVKVEEIAERHGMQADAARAHFLHANVLFMRGDGAECMREHRRSLELAREIGSAELEAAAIGGLGDAEFMRGHMVTALARFRECLELCDRGGFGRIAVANRPVAAFASFYAGDVRGALRDVLAALAEAAKVGHRRAKVVAHMSAYTCKYTLLDFAGARQHIDWTHKLATQLGSRRFESRALALRGELFAREGKVDEAMADLRLALAISREVGFSFGSAMVLGTIARLSEDATERKDLLAEAEGLIGPGTASPNTLFFRAEAIDACLAHGEWDEAEHHAAKLQAFLAEEPLAWSDFVSARARALAAHGRGRRDVALRHEIERLLIEGERYGYLVMLSALREAVADMPQRATAAE